MYKTTQELSSVLRVKDIVEVEPMNNAVRIVGEDEYKFWRLLLILQTTQLVLIRAEKLTCSMTLTLIITRRNS